MPGLDFLYSPNSQVYEAGQRMESDLLKNQQMGLQNQMYQAQIPGQIGQSQSLMAKGQLDQQMLPMQLSAQQQEIMGKMDEGHLKQLTNLGEKLGQVGGLLEQFPPMLRGEQFKSMAPKLGLDPNDPRMAPLFQLPPDKLSEALKKASETMGQYTSKAIQARQKEQMEQEGATQRQHIAGQYGVQQAQVRADASVQNAATAAEARVKSAEISAQKAIDVADKRAKLILGSMKPEQRWTYLNSIPDTERTPTEQAEFERLTKHQYNQKTLGNPSLAPEVMAGQTPTTPLQRAGEAAASITGASKQAPSNLLNQYKQKYPDKSEAEIRAAYKAKTGKDL